MGNRQSDTTKKLLNKLFEDIKLVLNKQEGDTFNFFCSKIILNILAPLIIRSTEEQQLKIFPILEKFGNFIFDAERDNNFNEQQLNISLNELLKSMEENSITLEWKGQNIFSTTDLIFCYNVK